MLREADLLMKMLLYCIVISLKQTFEEPNHKKHNKCFQYSITSGLDYNNIKKKYLKKQKNLKELIEIFNHNKDNGKNLNKATL